MQQLSLLQSGVNSYYKFRQLFDLLRIARGITKCDGSITNCNKYYKVRQYKVPSTMSGTVSRQELLPKFFLNGTFDNAENESMKVHNCGLSTNYYLQSRFAVSPKITEREMSKIVYVQQGSVLFLTCKAEGVPKPVVTWRKDGRLIQNKTDETYFKRENASKDDEGKYECEAFNSAGSDRYKVDVIIKGTNNFVEVTKNLKKQAVC